jgi:IS605 OrfB family transposase
VIFDVSVLCGAGGGLTVQPATNVISADIVAMTRTGPGTLFRVSAATGAIVLGSEQCLWRAAIVGRGCHDVGMAARTRLRRIADPVVAAPPPGVRVRTRIHPTEAEAAALTKIGAYLGSVYRGELAGRIRCGVLDRKGRAAWRTARKRALTAVASSRWAGAITRAVEDQYQLGMRGLAAHAADLRAAIDVLARRCALRPGQVAAIDPVEAGWRSRTRLGRGYRSAAERFAKTRRLAALRERSEKVEAALSAGRPTIVVGRKRFWCTRNHLDQAGLSTQQWRQSWDATRMFLTADGESGKPGGNETIRVDGAARLRIKTPAALVDQLGTHVALAASVRFAHRGDEWAARVAARRAVRYDLNYDSKRNRWYLYASWTLTPDPAPGLNELRAGRVLGVDLNADHLACCVLDTAGNPIAAPANIAMATAGLPASQRDGRVRAAITNLLDHAQDSGCGAVVVENLDFCDARATGRETLGRGRHGKRLRRTIAGIPTRRFRNRLTSMAARRGVAVIGVDAAYTSKWGAQHWRIPLQQQTSDPVTRHHAAAVAIGRRGLGVAIRRRPAGPRNGQRTAAGTPPARPNRHPGRDGKCGSSGPPTHPP